MKIKAIKIQHFKGIKELHIQHLNDVNIFIGKNNCSKTTILEAINTFFANQKFNSHLPVPHITTHYDLGGNVYHETKISLLFELPENIYDNLNKDEKEDFKQHYGHEIWITKHKFSQNNPEISQSYQIECDPSPNLAQNAPHVMTEHIIKAYAGDNKIRFVSSVDGLKTANNNPQKYYDIYEGKQKKENSLRTGMEYIVTQLNSLMNADEYEYLATDFIDEFKNFSSTEFADIKIRDQNILSKFGEREKLHSIPYYNQGDGELDTLELFWLLHPISFPEHTKNTCKLYIIDEPENHKHISLQRKFLNKFLKLADGTRQFFICTHSPVFTSQYKNPKVNAYLITKDLEKDSNYVKEIRTISSQKETKEELGLLNIDSFFSDAILLVEGKTEEEVIPAIFNFYDKDEISLGLKIYEVGGNDKINLEHLKITLELLTETNITLYIILDNENNAEKNRDELLKLYPDLFTEEKEQYHLWDNKYFVNALPENIILSAFNNLLKDKGSKKQITSKGIQEKRKNDSNLENLFKYIYHEKIKATFPKPTFGKYIAQEIANIPSEEKKNYENNEIFKQIKTIIDKVEA